ncbi:GNAT family N-acetyltransferase [Granulicella rosea]|nr:GNAT family N-acetyltransferase [Granulicella rosea]
MQDTPEIRIEVLDTLPAFERCVELQLATWGYDGGDVIPRKMFLVAHKIGGMVLGAFDGDVMIGFAMGLPGFRKGVPYLHSHMLAVLPEYRNAGIGRRLKLAQRDVALERGFDLMEWTFDPLEIKNAYLNIAKLGAIARRYEPDFYGASSSPLQGGLPTDRLCAEWWLRSPRVKAVLAGAPLAIDAIETIEVPAAVYRWKQSEADRGLAADLQRLNRLALQDSFVRGLAVVGYALDGERNGRFLIGRTDL